MDMLVSPAPALLADEACFHCAEALPSQAPWRGHIGGRERRFCCAGCLAVAQTIHAAGLDAFYAQRTQAPPRTAEPAGERERHVAAAVASGLVRDCGDGVHEASLILEGMQCGACAWLVEAWLRRQTAVVDARVNFAMRRALVRWRGAPSGLTRVLDAIGAIGYAGYVYDRERREASNRREARALLLRMGVALLAMMQVMMLALPSYIGDDSIEPRQQALLDWASLVLTLPVVLYAAWPFAAGAWRSLRLRTLGMDVPIALGVGGAFVASAWATASGTGAVYFDSVTMFVALLLVARYAELRSREKAATALEGIARDLPMTAQRMDPKAIAPSITTIPAHALVAGDRILVGAGAAIPADGIVVDGVSSVEEALLTGESAPRSKTVGARVLAGSLNRESPLVVQVTAAGPHTALAALGRMVERAAGARPRAAALADAVAAWFVGALLVIALATAAYWWAHEPSRALAIAFAVLVVSCPCALSLATPCAITAAAGALGRRGILAVRPDAFETLARCTRVVLDKTGTLTFGRPRLVAVEALGAFDRERCLAVAAALEEGAAHPVAEALRAQAVITARASGIVTSLGDGVEGVVDGVRYRCGRPEWVAAPGKLALSALAQATPPASTVVALADDSNWIALFVIEDALRPGARELVARLRGLGLDVTLLSGDRAPVVQHVAATLGIGHWHADARPGDKVAFVAACQARGAVVAMAGDGVNDAPALAKADVSLAMGDAAMITQWSADLVILDESPAAIATACAGARRTRLVIRQNLAWAFAYNVVAVPAAALGLVSPLAAAAGMSLSSLVVVANALRLSRM